MRNRNTTPVMSAGMCVSVSLHLEEGGERTFTQEYIPHSQKILWR